MNDVLTLLGTRILTGIGIQERNEDGKEEPSEFGLQLMVSEMQVFPSSAHWKNPEVMSTSSNQAHT